MGPHPAATFDSFVPTPASSAGFAAAVALAHAAPEGPRLLCLHGPAGVGKTHLLGAIVHTALIRRPATSIVRISGKELVEDLVSAARSNDAARFRRRYNSAELLAVDDLHVLTGKPVTQNEVARLLTPALDGGGRVVCVAGCPLAAIPVLAAGIGRLPGAVLVEMRRPYGRSMRTIVAAAAAAMGLTLDRRTVASIAARSHGDVRQGAGALTRLRFEHRR